MDEAHAESWLNFWLSQGEAKYHFASDDTMLKKRVEEFGFAIVPEVVAPDEVLRLRDEFSKTSLRRTKAGVRHAMRVPCVAAIAGGSKLRGMAQEILGEDAAPFRATLFDKSVEANWLVVWHQDTALPLCEKKEVPGWGPWSVKEGVVYAHAPTEALRRVIALRVHLDDSEAENGPLRVLPGSHRFGVMDEEPIRALASELAAVNCLVALGGVLAMRPLVVHASSKSRSKMPRRVLHIEYANSMRIGGGLELAIA